MAAAMIGMLAFHYFWLSYTQIETIPYSAFERLLSAELTLNHRSMRALATKTPSGR
jgi:hypothetical protein